MNALAMRGAGACVFIGLVGSTVSAQTTLTLPDALARARANAPAVIGATAAIAEARARLIEANLRFRENPEFNVAAGGRRGGGAQSLDVSVAALQALEPQGRRAGRIEAANAFIRTAESEVAVVALEAMALAASAYLDAWHAQREAATLALSEQVTGEVLRAAETRFSLGDIAALEVNAARAERARATAERLNAEAAAAGSLGELRVLLRLPADEPVVLSEFFAGAVDLATLLPALETRPDLRALASEIDQASAELRLAATFRRPELAIGAEYAREESDNILLGALRLRLPVFNQAQGEIAILTARAERLRRERDTRLAAAEAALRGEYDAYRLRLQAVETLEREALPPTVDNETLARRSYEVGQISLVDWLVLRREAVLVQREYWSQRRELAVSRLRLHVTSGVLQ